MPHPFKFVENFPHGQPAPKSPGLPPSGPLRKTNAPRDREARLHPKKTGRPSLKEAEEIIRLTVAAALSGTPPTQVARLVARDPATIKALIKSAREDLQSRAADYVEAHWNATKVAADLGDAKPAQWAIERISEGEQRIVEKEKAGTSSPSISIGIALGGIPAAKGFIDTTPIAVTEIPAKTDKLNLPEIDLP